MLQRPKRQINTLSKKRHANRDALRYVSIFFCSKWRRIWVAFLSGNPMDAERVPAPSQCTQIKNPSGRFCKSASPTMTWFLLVSIFETTPNRVHQECGNDHFCDTTKKHPKDYHIKQRCPCIEYCRSGDKPLDPPTLQSTNLRNSPNPGGRLSPATAAA